VLLLESLAAVLLTKSGLLLSSPLALLLELLVDLLLECSLVGGDAMTFDLLLDGELLLATTEESFLSFSALLLALSEGELLEVGAASVVGVVVGWCRVGKRVEGRRPMTRSKVEHGVGVGELSGRVETSAMRGGRGAKGDWSVLQWRCK
jgi:hypothetical protein